METLLALEMVRVTEAAALASARFMGRGEKDEADHAATEAMRRTMDEVEMQGTIVIGEGERDEAPMLWIGEPVGTGGPSAVAIDIAVDPLEGTNLVAHGQNGAITVLAASEAGGLLHAPDTYLDKLCVGPGAAGHVDIRQSPTENVRAIASALRRDVRDITIVILERTATRGAHRGGAGRPARASSSSPTATCQRPSAAPCRARASTGCWASAARPRVSSRPRHSSAWAARSRPASGSATTTSAHAPSGWVPSRTRIMSSRPTSWRPVRTSCSRRTGVTRGDLLDGVRFFGGGARTNSLVMAYRSKEVRFVDTVHMFDRTRPPAVRL